MGFGASVATAELDCRPIRADRVRYLILPARSSRGRADDRDVWGGLSPIHGPNVTYPARNLLKANQSCGFRQGPSSGAPKRNGRASGFRTIEIDLVAVDGGCRLILGRPCDLGRRRLGLSRLGYQARQDV